nr:GNAT family N-acetyltransferase [Burkholderia cenocepacia]
MTFLVPSCFAGPFDPDDRRRCRDFFASAAISRRRAPAKCISQSTIYFATTHVDQENLQKELLPMPVTRTTLRAATPHDANHIARLHTLSWQTAYSHILPASYLSDEVPTEHAVRWRKYFDRNENEWGLVLIAESNGEPVGFVSAERPVDPALGVLLDCLHVHPSHHGGGTGKRMIEAVRAWARSIGVDKVHLQVLEGNVRAIGFYEHNGWQLAGVETSRIGQTEVTDRIYAIQA